MVHLRSFIVIYGEIITTTSPPLIPTNCLVPLLSHKNGPTYLNIVKYIYLYFIFTSFITITMAISN